jgi:uncharacterized membrane protein
MRTLETQQVRPSIPSGKGIKIERAITVGLPAPEVYTFWRRLENLPRFLHHIESVTQTDDRHSHWEVKAPRGKVVKWDAEIIEERSNEMFSWRSLPGSDVDNAGSVWFIPAPGGRGTVVKISLKYAPPAGRLGAVVAKLWGRDAETEIAEDLYRFKSLLEAGEIPTTQGQPRAAEGGRR